MPIPKIENKLAALKEDFETKYAAELGNVKKDIETILENLDDLLKSVEEKDRAKVLKSAKIIKLVAALGIKAPADDKKKGKGKGRGKGRMPRAELTGEAVIAFIGKGTKTKSELSAHFKGGNVIVVKFLDAMVKDKQLEANVSKGAKGTRGKPATIYKVI